MTERPNPFEALTLEQLRARRSAKWRHYPQDVLPLWVAEMDVELAAPIAEALNRLVETGDAGYPGDTPYREAFASFATDTWGWDPSVARTREVASVIAGYTDALVEAVGPGGTVVVTSPVYPPFYSYLGQAGLTVVEVPLTEDLRLDLDGLEAAFAGAQGFLLCNPHNPGGTVHTRAELEAVASLASQHGVQVVSDEIHAPLVYAESTFVPYLAVDPRGIAVHAASKGWSLAAIPAALLTFGPDAGAALARYDAGKHHGPTYWGTVAQTVAYSQGRDWLADALAGLDANRRLLGALLAERLPEVRYHVPAATYLTWVDCRGLELGDDPARVFLERGRVAFNPGHTFGTGGAGHVRINIATSPAILGEAVARMAASL
ncbi:MalY/PatB family protein [Demequina sp.]|uniref:MalY/PatB family protein n=1 Tax=Demequina sp. TaxID=2050685 RepID=UPI003D128635